MIHQMVGVWVSQDAMICVALGIACKTDIEFFVFSKRPHPQLWTRGNQQKQSKCHPFVFLTLFLLSYKSFSFQVVLTAKIELTRLLSDRWICSKEKHKQTCLLTKKIFFDRNAIVGLLLIHFLCTCDFISSHHTSLNFSDLGNKPMFRQILVADNELLALEELT